MPREIRGESPSAPARPPRRTRYPNLSPTRPPSTASDGLDLWPLWADVPIDQGGLVLLDEHGRRITPGGETEMSTPLDPAPYGPGNGDGDGRHQETDVRIRKWLEAARRGEEKDRDGQGDPARTVAVNTVKPTTAIGLPPRNGEPRRTRAGTLVTRRLSAIEPEEFDWLWEGRIPRGMLTLFSGDKGSGKSTLAGWIAAAVSRGGEWPDDPGRVADAGRVLYLNAEENPSQVVRPRLERFGADLDRVELVEGVRLAGDDEGREHPFSLALDLDTFIHFIERRKDVRLLIMDTIASFLGDAYKGHEIRRILDPLKMVAEKHRMAIILINHLNKGNGTKAIYRSKDAIDIPNLCRMTWLVAPDPDDRARSLLVPNNCNFAAAPALAFRIDREGGFAWDPEPIDGLDANGLLVREAHVLARAGRRGPVARKRHEAEQWLVKALAEGPVLLATLIAEGARLGFTRATLDRALKHLKAEVLETDGVKFYQIPPQLNLAPGAKEATR